MILTPLTLTTLVLTTLVLTTLAYYELESSSGASRAAQSTSPSEG
jgi:hypothetical protein